MKYLALTILTLIFSLTSTDLFAQFESQDSSAFDSTYSDTLYNDSLYNDFPMDSSYQDEAPGTVKEILNESAQNVGQMGKQTLNNLTDKATYETGQFLNRQADKLVNGIKQKLAAKKKSKQAAKAKQQNSQKGKLVGKKTGNQQNRN